MANSTGPATPPPHVEGEITARGRRVAIAAARFNEFIVSSLIDGATGAWRSHGGAADELLVARVPGAFELPVAVRKLAVSGRFEEVVAMRIFDQMLARILDRRFVRALAAEVVRQIEGANDLIE